MGNLTFPVDDGRFVGFELGEPVQTIGQNVEAKMMGYSGHRWERMEVVEEPRTNSEPALE